MLSRWIIYQKERFPLLKYGLIVSAFTYSGLCVSSMMRGAAGLPDPKAFLMAFPAALILFLQLRVADEFKDREEDALYQPERPVPRGLVALDELFAIGITGAAVQFLLTIAYHGALLLPLAVTWLYFLLMSREFFIRDWLKARPFTYLWTHMLILLFVDIYITSFDWLVAGTAAPAALLLFLGVSFLNGVVIEIGRKIKSPQEERPGVETYTKAWGIRGALSAWLAAVVGSAIFALATAYTLQFFIPVLIVTSCLVLLAVALIKRFTTNPQTELARRFEDFSGIWTLLMYLCLGAVPCILRAI